MIDGARTALVAVLGFCIIAGSAGCGGSAPEPKNATDAPEKTAPGDEPKAESSADDKTDDKPADGTDKKPEEGTSNEPTFPEGASVDQATAAVPKGGSRSNLDAERLAEPLQQETVFAPCNVGSQHFAVRVAVWGGKAVGVDVTTPNKKFGECIDKQIRALSWPDKIHSLNTVEFSY